MKTIPVLSCLAGLLLATPAGLSAPGTPAEPKPAKPVVHDPSKPYVLFMGADLAVLRDKRYYRVEDVTGSEFKIRIGKREFFVPTRNRSTNLKVNNSLKLASGFVQLDGLESGPSYTPLNDPMRKFVNDSGAAAGAAAVRDLAYGKMIQAEMGLAQATNAANGTSGQGAAAAEAARLAAQEAYNAASEAASMANTDYTFNAQNDVTAAADRMNRERAEGNYDAMEVSFKISSAVDLDDPYVVILFRFQERDAKPGDQGLLIHARRIDPIGAKPKYVRIREAGLPRGFKYLDSEVHVYNHGEEVATNVSPKRVELSRSEAQEYLVIEHIGANKGATLPAVPVPGTLPAVQRGHLTVDQLNRTFYAKVSKDGAFIAAYADEGCNLKLEDAVTLGAMGTVFFKPALEKGKPVEGTARVRLAEI